MTDKPGYVLVDLDCGCQDVHFANGDVDREHDHVECTGFPDDFKGAGPMFAAIPLGEPWLDAATKGATTYVLESPYLTDPEMPYKEAYAQRQAYAGYSAFLDKDQAAEVHSASDALLVRWDGLISQIEPEAC